jgi:glycosyltransferase involved in cell wall biosynthesis
MSPAFGCVVLTRGNRPDDLDRAVGSLLRQRGVAVDVVVVGNGWEPSGLPPGVRGVGLAQDAGIPAGRNAGVPHARGELLFFLDDDASVVDDDALARLARDFAADPSLGLVQLRVAPRTPGHEPRDWVPRLRVGDRTRSSDVTVVWEGAVAMPRHVFDEVGGWPGEFRFVHEGVDLAWRVMDAGYRVRYRGDLAALHPPPPPIPAPGRHGYAYYFGARNRVWLGRRHLPLPLATVYVATFAARTLPGIRSVHDLRQAARGYRDGLRRPCGERRPLRARTLWRMTRAGRPPVI